MAEEKKTVQFENSSIVIDEEELKARAKKLGLQTEEESFAGKFEKILDSFSRVDPQALLDGLNEISKGDSDS